MSQENAPLALVNLISRGYTMQEAREKLRLEPVKPAEQAPKISVLPPTEPATKAAFDDGFEPLPGPAIAGSRALPPVKKPLGRPRKDVNLL